MRHAPSPGQGLHAARDSCGNKRSRQQSGRPSDRAARHLTTGSRPHDQSIRADPEPRPPPSGSVHIHHSRALHGLPSTVQPARSAPPTADPRGSARAVQSVHLAPRAPGRGARLTSLRALPGRAWARVACRPPTRAPVGSPTTVTDDPGRGRPFLNRSCSRQRRRCAPAACRPEPVPPGATARGPRARA